MEEYLDVVDENDLVVGRRTLKECLESGLLHRAVVVFLQDMDGRLYIQKRSSQKAWYPGYWSPSCAGHVSSGETYLEAARREMREELGVACELTFTAKFLTPKWSYGKVTEWEYDALFVGTVGSTDFTLGEEVETGKWVGRGELSLMLRTGQERFTPDSAPAFEEYLRALEVGRKLGK